MKESPRHRPGGVSLSANNRGETATATAAFSLRDRTGRLPMKQQPALALFSVTVFCYIVVVCWASKAEYQLYK
jgi:hypothetical protein